MDTGSIVVDKVLASGFLILSWPSLSSLPEFSRFRSHLALVVGWGVGSFSPFAEWFLSLFKAALGASHLRPSRTLDGLAHWHLSLMAPSLRLSESLSWGYNFPFAHVLPTAFWVPQRQASYFVSSENGIGHTESSKWALFPIRWERESDKMILGLTWALKSHDSKYSQNMLDPSFRKLTFS